MCILINFQILFVVDHSETNTFYLNAYLKNLLDMCAMTKAQMKDCMQFFSIGIEYQS